MTALDVAAMAIVWLPTAVGLAAPTAVLLFVWLRSEIAKRHGSDESHGPAVYGGQRTLV